MLWRDRQVRPFRLPRAPYRNDDSFWIGALNTTTTHIQNSFLEIEKLYDETCRLLHFHWICVIAHLILGARVLVSRHQDRALGVTTYEATNHIETRRNSAELLRGILSTWQNYRSQQYLTSCGNVLSDAKRDIVFRKLRPEVWCKAILGESIKLIHLSSIILPSNSIFCKVYVYLYCNFSIVKELEQSTTLSAPPAPDPSSSFPTFL